MAYVIVYELSSKGIRKIYFILFFPYYVTINTVICIETEYTLVWKFFKGTDQLFFTISSLNILPIPTPSLQIVMHACISNEHGLLFAILRNYLFYNMQPQLVYKYIFNGCKLP